MIEQCTYINAIREYYPHTVFRIQDIMNDKYVCEFIYKAMHKYDNLSCKTT